LYPIIISEGDREQDTSVAVYC